MLNHFQKHDPPFNGEVLSIILNQVSDAIFICDGLGDITYSAGNIPKIFGYSASEINQISQITQLIEPSLFGKLIVAAKKAETLLQENPSICDNFIDKFGNNHWLKIKLKKLPYPKKVFY
jgi:PAS domain S-box-containing protein